MSYYGWSPYVPVAVRRQKAAQKLAKLAKGGRQLSPVLLQGRAIATTFWGKAWNQNLEAYSDYSNRLPRGRTYVRNGSVLDLQIQAGEVRALVSGSEIYEVLIEVAPVAKAAWAAIRRDCSGGIESLVELLQGRLSKGVMERLCRQRTGLFPTPGNIRFSCSCPDVASMCKHVAAVLYGVGARLDDQPDLLFTLRQVAVEDLLASAGKGLPVANLADANAKVLEDESLAELFDLEMAGTPAPRKASAMPATHAKPSPKATNRPAPKKALKPRPKARAAKPASKPKGRKPPASKKADPAPPKATRSRAPKPQAKKSGSGNRSGRGTIA